MPHRNKNLRQNQTNRRCKNGGLLPAIFCMPALSDYLEKLQLGSHLLYAAASLPRHSLPLRLQSETTRVGYRHRRLLW